MTAALQTPAWLLVGLFRSEPGELELREGHLSFRSFRATDGIRFEVPVTEMRYLAFPWYYFGAGVKFEIGGRRYRLSFVRPTSEGGSVFDIAQGREAGEAWQRVLAQAQGVDLPRSVN